MSDSDYDNTIVLDEVLHLPSVVCTLTQMLNAKVEEVTAIPRKKNEV